MIGIVYCFESPSKKKYVGITINPDLRYKEHERHSKRLNTLFYRAIRKYGFENFSYEILEEVNRPTKEELWVALTTLEKEYIKKLDTYNPENGYNCTLGGDGVVGHKFTKEQLEKISRALKGKMVGSKNPMYGKVGTFKGKKHTEETKKRLSEIHSGKTLTEEHKRKIGESGKGKLHTEESKKIMSEQQTKLKGKKVYCEELDLVFGSISEAVRKTGADKGSIREVCNGNRIKAKGYTFRWLVDDAIVNVEVTNKAKRKIKCKETGEVFESIADCCDKMGLRHQHVSAVLHGRQKTTKEYSFEFA